MTTKQYNNFIQLVGSKLDSIIGMIANSFNAQPSSRVTLFEWMDKWFAIYKAPFLKDHGYDMGNSIAKHIKANIQDKPLCDYDGADIQEALRLIPSSRMAQVVYSIYNQCFDAAVKEKHIASSPMSAVIRPKHIVEKGRALTLQEQRQFMLFAQKSQLFPLFEFYLLTGCRRSEALLLEWKDISGERLKIRGTKTKNAERNIPILPKVREILDKLPRTSKYIFPYGVEKVRYEFEKIRAELSFDSFTLHDLRHTFATRCLERGVTLKTVQKWLGHADYTTTANIYSHITSDFEQKELEKLCKQGICSSQ